VDRSSVQTSAIEEISKTETFKAQEYLSETLNRLMREVSDLSPAQWNFRPASGGWSIAEILEHLALVENAFMHSVGPQLSRNSPAELFRARQLPDALLIDSVGRDRSKRSKAPVPVSPTGRWSRTETLERLVAARAQTTQFLSSNPELRRGAVKHPGLGFLDGFQWVLFLAAHTERHMRQIFEVKGEPAFPST
jgi:hypothetical protein